MVKLEKKERERLLNLEKILESRVIGQKEAISSLANSIRRNRSKIHDKKKPMGVFMFLGQSGVGKTELCKALTEFLFDSEKSMIKLDMSEYSKKDSIK